MDKTDLHRLKILKMIYLDEVAMKYRQAVRNGELELAEKYVKELAMEMVK